MIRLKLYSAPYDPNGKRMGEGPDFGPSWQERFNDYLEHGWFRNNIGAVIMKLMEGATWEKYEPYTYRDRDNKCHHAFMLRPATRFAMVVAENSRRGEYTWLPVQDADELRTDMVKSGWKMCDFRQFPALLKAFYIDKEDVGFAEGMRRFNKTVEVRYKKRVFNGKFDEIWPQLEPKEYNTTRLILAINKGLLARPLPYPDVPMFYTPRCSEEPALRDWVFTQLTEKFYEYLDEGALDCEDFGDVLRDLLPNEPMRRVDRYTFGDKRQGTFSPGNLEPHMQQALAIAENARRGICTEVPPEFGAYWRSLPHSIPWWMTMVADRESVCEFWNNPDEFPRVPRDGSPHPKIPNETVNLVRINAQKSPLQNILPDLYNLRKSNTLKSRTPIRESKLSDLVHGTKFDPDAEPDRLLAALQAALPGRRCGFAGRTHHTPLDCYEACGLYDSEDPKYGWYGHLREHHLKHLLQTAGENCACDSPRTPVQPYRPALYRTGKSARRPRCCFGRLRR